MIALWKRRRLSVITYARMVTPVGEANGAAAAGALDLKAPEVPGAEPGSVCPVCQHGRMQLITTLYRQPAVWDLSMPMPYLDTS